MSSLKNMYRHYNHAVTIHLCVQAIVNCMSWVHVTRCCSNDVGPTLVLGNVFTEETVRNKTSFTLTCAWCIILIQVIDLIYKW